MKSYFAYVRVSTQRQGTHGSSLQEQRSAIEAYATRNGLRIAVWYEERETAAKSGRRVFRRMLSETARRKAAGIIVHKIDRSARNLRDWAELNDLIDRGLEVHFAHDALDLSSRGGRLSADIQAVVAADFIRNLREETRKGFYGRLKQGIYPLAAPIGYLDMGKGKPKALDPAKAPLVRLAFELYATGEYNFEQLGNELFKRGLRGKAGNRVSKNGLTTMLNNPFYVSLIHIRKTNELFQGAHAPLLPKSLYDRVQAVLRGERLGVEWKHDFAFRRTIRCAACNRHLIGERQKRRYIYYRCHGAGHACISESSVDKAVRESLRLLTLTDEEVRDIRDLIAKDNQLLINAERDREAALTLSVTKLDERIARLTDALIDGLIEKDVFDERKARAMNERMSLSEELTNARSGGSFSDFVIRNVELANTAYLEYETGDLYARRELLAKAMSNLRAEGKSLAFTLDPALQGIINYRQIYGCDLRRDEPRTHAKGLLKILRREFDKEKAAMSPKSQSPRLSSL
jgi:site-specific DNA recombinase